MNPEELLMLLRKIGSIYLVPVTAIIGTIFYYKYKHTFLKWFLFLLWYAVFNELLGRYLRVNLEINNRLFYNIYHIINFSTLLLIFRHFINNASQKKLINYFIILFWVTSVVNLFFQDFTKDLQTIPYIVAGVCLITSILLYLFDVLKTDKVLYITKTLLFWISVGLFIGLVCNIPIRVLRNFTHINTSITIAILFINILTYLFFIIGFIWSSKNYQS